ncbi:MAG: hypothetical protein LAO05_12240 [Acidobacteriia bacterium]|nr:hypothetical protein [Terriglobia bacterium]
MAAEGGIRLRSSALILVLSGLTLVLGFAVQVALAATLGTSREMDIFLVAVTLPTLLATVSLTVSSFFLVPALNERLTTRGDAAATALAATTVRRSALVAFVVVVALEVGAAPAIRVVAPGLDPDAVRSAAALLRIMLIGSLFDLLRGVLTAIQYSRDRFLLPQLAPSLNHALLVLSALFLLKPFGLVGLATGWSLGSLAMFVALLPALRGLHVLRPNAGVPLSEPGVGGGGLLPILVVAGLTQLSPVIDRLVASLLPAGSISYLGYGSKMLEILVRTVPMAVALSAFPVLSRHAASGDRDRLRSTALAALRWALLGAVPLALGVLVFRVQIVRVLFQRGAFDAEATRNVARACAWYAVAFVPASVAYLFNHVLFAARKAWFLAGVGLGSLVLTAALDLALARTSGFVGVAQAFLVVSTVQVVILGGFLQLRWRQFSGALLLPFTAQVAGACAAMAATWAATWTLTKAWSTTLPALWLGFDVGAGLAVFVLVLWWLRNSELRSALEGLSGTIGRSRPVAGSETR